MKQLSGNYIKQRNMLHRAWTDKLIRKRSLVVTKQSVDLGKCSSAALSPISLTPNPAPVPAFSEI
jgi:hypothetical protein